MDSGNGHGAKVGKAPPYGSYKTFRTFIDDIHTHGVPGRVDRSVLGRFSGTVRTQLLSGLRSLNLIDDADQPTNALRDLKAAFGTDNWGQALSRVLETAYAPVMALNLEHATPSQLNEAFRHYPVGSEEVRRRCVVFFLSAAQDAALPISKRITDAMRRGAGSAPKRKPKADGPTEQPAPPPKNSSPPPKNPSSTDKPAGGTGHSTERYQAAYDALSACWEPDGMDPDVDKAFVSVLRHLRLKALGRDTAPKGP